MHFIVNNKKDLFKKVNLNVKTIERNFSITSLSNIKLEVSESELILTSYDGNNCVISKVNIENIDGQNGAVLIDSLVFKNIIDRVRSIDSESIEFEVLEESKELRIVAGTFRLKVKTSLDVSDFDVIPSLDKFNMINKVSFDKEVLLDAVSNVAKYSSKDATKPFLESVNLVIKDNACDVVCLDGYRLALNIIECKSDEDFNISVSALKLKSVLSDISFMSTEMNIIELKTDGKYALIQIGDISIFIREIEGKVAPYKQLLDKKYQYKLTGNKKEFLDVIKSSMLATNRDSKIVRLDLNPDNNNINISSKGDVISDFVDEVNVLFDMHNGQELVIIFNAVYLLEIINSVKTERFNLFLKDSLSPVYVENENDEKSSYLVLPVRLAY